MKIKTANIISEKAAEAFLDASAATYASSGALGLPDIEISKIKKYLGGKIRFGKILTSKGPRLVAGNSTVATVFFHPTDGWKGIPTDVIKISLK
jgi:hypothetical protein